MFLEEASIRCSSACIYYLLSGHRTAASDVYRWTIRTHFDNLGNYFVLEGIRTSLGFSICR